MRKLIFLSLLLGAIYLVAGCGLRQLQADEKVSKDEEYTGEHFDIINLAKGFIEQLSNGEYKEAVERLDDSMIDKLNSEELEEIWLGLEEEFGDYIQQEFHSAEKIDRYYLVFITGSFKDADLTFRLTIDMDNQITDLRIR
ncbi:MAG: DUF3887 domain-containing protein [Tissierellaceae bacterium]|jgi:hypothetical protein|nr:DUF3887 domain-containing protein [Tissierellia bacterium]